MPHGQRAVGWPRRAHVRDRRRWRNLRHRRPRLQRHLVQRRVGQHRRRYAARLDQGVVGGTGWVLHGVLQGEVLEGYSRDTQGVRTRPAHPRTHFRPFARAALPPSQDICMQLPMLSHAWPACLSARNVCLLLRAVARARARVCANASRSVCVRVRAQRWCTNALPSHGGDVT
jgi:hypothetical protein